ncbi:VCBS domain-containing protein [Pseudomonas sp. FP1740]|uniref:VCBS domain-containing protein n=1 Tax=Pseudomonas sp. FP1740 TaxID=2954078 RepID=UPI00273721A5|nr:VCBS domain-containing protein [Pseudomonas sp. FP1740]WLG43675.1 VCBS domain-containing protein [Pseudomonas sp. FP1740]
MATTTTTSDGTVTSFSNTPQAQDDIFTTGVIGTSSSTITEDLLGVVYLDVMSNDLGGSAKTLWSVDNATSLSTATKVYAPADLLVQDTSRIEATSTDTSLNGAKIWITSDGKVGYDAATLSTAFKAQLQSLAAGASLADSFTYAIRLGNGTLSWATAQVQFAGMNDSVTMNIGVQAGTVTEDAPTTPSTTDSLSTTGTIAFSDVDLSDTHTASFVAAGGNTTALGNFSLASVIEAANAANGTVNWTYTVNNAAAQYLAQGQTATETYVVTLNDGHGSSTTQNVVITLTGTNDQVHITSGVQTGDAKEDSGDYAANGSITFTDADLIDTHSVTVTPGASGYLGSFTTDPLHDSTGTGSGSLGWHFAVDNAAVQFLGEGQTLTQTYNVAIGDGTVQTVTITITGTNDRPTLTIADTTGAMSEGNGTATLSDSGALSFADVDNIDVVTVSHTSNGNIAWSGGTLDAGVASALVAGFSVDHNSWDYSTSQNLDFLGAGETVTFSYTVVATDNSGAANAVSATQTVTITITGSNDAPVLSFATGNDAGAVQEDTTLSVSGQFSSSDIDHAATATWSIAGSNTGTYGSIAVDSSGQWTYTLANGTDGVASAVQSLKAGESHNEVFSVQVSDGLGGVATHLVTVTVTGSNDAPVLSFASGNDAGAVQEDSTLSVNGQFSSSDIDHAATATWSIAGSNTGSYGSIAVDSSGQWTYTLANGTDGVASAVQSLKAGESHNEVFSVQVSDGLGGVATHLVTVTVTGSNDAPVLSFATGNDAGAVQEDTTLSVSGQFSSSDIDHAATATWSINGSATGTYGSIAVDSTGQWTYTLANGTNGVASAVQSLQAGESHNEVFTIQVSDGLGGVDTQQVTVTVTGSNDAPVLSFASGNDVGAVQEDTTLSVSGQFSSSDIDHAATATWSIAGSNTGSYGSIAVDSTGQWTYTLANGTDGVASAVQSLQAGETHNEVFTLQVSDGLGGVDTQQVTVTVTGSNDAPVLSFASGNDAGAVQEDSTLSVSGQFSSADIDHAATATWSINGSATGTYGSIAVDSSGQWTYTLANGTDGVASAVQSLKAGESHNEVFSVQVSDGLGGVATHLVTVTVTGSNDAPVLSFASGNDVGAVQEDTTLSVSGQFSSSDIDHNATATWSINGSATGTYGSIAVDGSGQWTYTLANGTDGVASAVQSLQAGETHNEVFTLQVSDGLGGVDTQQVTVTVTGSNDAPVLSFASGNDAGAVQEDTTLSVSGQFSSSDIDHAATATWSINGSATGTYGSIAVDGSGQWTYTLANGTDGVASAVQSLQAGESHNEVFSVQVSDGLGGVATHLVTVTVTGSNDAPVLSFASGNDVGAVQEDTTLSVSGQFSSSDIDHAATATWSIAGSNTGSYGSIAVDSTGQWTYTLANGTDGVASAVQSLQAGESHNEVFTIQVSDGLGGVDTQQVTVTVTGSNDAPVLSFASGNDAGAVQEDSTLSVNGQFSSSDIDHAATATWSIAGSNTGSYGSIAVDSSGQWTYTLANGTDGVASAVQSLKAGESHNEVFSVQVSDGLGGVATHLVTVTVTGSNDAPVLSFASGNDAGAVQEDSSLSVSGQFSSSDIDHAATATWSINGSATGTYGSIAVDSSGQWTYTLANGTDGVASAVQSLKAGESHNEVFSVQVSDGLGGVATHLVTVTVTGSNDAPVLSFATGNDAGAVQEDTTLSVSGQFSSTDIDHAATATWSIAGSNTGSYGSIAVDSSGQWTYTLANGTDGVASAVQSLKAGESHNEVFSVQVSDGLGGVATHLVTVTVTGSNDAPVLSFASGNDAGAVQEDSTLSVSGQFSSSDIDHAATATWSINGSATGTYGSIAVDGSGQWTYTLANGTDGVASAVQSLKAGETHNEVFTIQVSDGLGGVDTQQVTVTVTGSNDAPVLSFASGNDAGNVQEDTTLSVSGQFSSSDIDHAATATWSIAGSNTGSYGSIAVDSSGQWTYTLANGTNGVASAVQSLQAGESHNEVFTIQVSDGLGGVDTQQVTVTVTGSNDAPVLSFASGNDAGAVQEDTTLSVSGQFSSSDIDHAATATWSIAGSNTGTYGSIAVDSSGQWTYTLANGTNGVASAVQSLQAGESHNEVFTLQVSDGLGGVDTQQVTVTVTGSNDAPVLSFASGNDAGAVQEDSTLSVSGQFSSADIDHAATATWSINGSATGTYGSIAVDSTGQWTYTLANGTNGVASAVQSLQAGESHNEVFTIQVSDGLGGVDTQQVTVTVTGSNDAPVLSFASGNDVGTVQEDTTLSVSGQFSSSDIDHAATATWSIAGSNTGTYGSIAVDSTGQWTYTLANGTNGVASAVQSLQAGETHNEVFTLQVSDGLGGVDTQQVTVTVTGSNDVAVLSSASVTLTETNAPLTTGGSLTVSDIDSPESFHTQTNTAGSYGQFSIGTDGAWTYVANSAHNEFAAGTTYTDTFTVSSADGTLTSVTVHILGTNDAAVLSTGIANLTETNAAVDISTAGTLTISDVDSAATFVAQTNTAGSYGQFSIGTDGAWTYVANSAHNEFAAGTTYTDTFAVSSADGTLTSVTVHILGTNDAAVLSAGTANLTETNAAVDISTAGTLTISDVDSAATFVAQTNIAGSYGQFSIGTDGAWTYVANSAHNEFAAGTTYTDTFAVSSADGTLTSVTVHILGTNDAAVLSAGTANLTETNAAVDISTAGTLTISDVDSAATFVAQTNTAGSYGQFSIGTDGAWTYVANSAHNEFAAGTTYTDTFAVSSADGTLTSVTVHILGTNDAAVLSAGTANLTETNAAVDISTAGTLTISDVDSAATFVAQTNIAGSYGQFSIGTDGAWTYVANSAHNEFAAGTTYTDTFAVSSADGTLTSVTVHIAGSNDSPTITSNGAGATASINVAENTTAITTVTATDVDLPAQTLSYSIVGGVDAAKFSIVSGTGVLSFISAPNFEAPTDTGTNNVYDVIVRASDGTLFDDQAIAVTVTGVNDNSPVITSNGAGATASVNVAENTTAVTTVAATDADLPAQTLTYSIVGGVDAAKFSIVSGTGVLSFISAPNFEAPTDSGTNNVYDVIVRASDGTLFDDQAIAVTVTGVNDNSPVITSNGAGATASVNVAENTTAVTTVVATDADLPAQTLSYSILNTAGTDFSKFSISSSGVLTFNSAPDYENPQDVGGTDGDNAYVVDVQVADGNGGIDTQTITVNVQNVVETPVDTVAPTVTVTGTALGTAITPIPSTSTVTFQFSEVVSGFSLSDVTMTTTSGTPRGTWSNFTQVDGDTYTATLTRTQSGSIKVDVAANSYTDLAGNPGAAGSSANLPAGVAGDPINLALNAPLADISGPITVSISGVPSGWVFNAGTDNGDGTWTVQTSDPGALTVTTPSDFVGALVLDVNMNWSNSDGSTASAYVFNNVEVYAPGAPIFALSADDNLTGSSGADTFVFAQPIGNNQIYNFDAAADKIDLIGFTGVTGFADLSITNDANGNALVSISTGQTVTLKGVDAADLSEANFQFDVDPLTNNSGTLTIADGAIMPFGGSIHNSGTIELGSAGSATSLEILFRGATLTGGGQVLLSDNAQNVIFGGSADTVLNNVDNRISGAGQLGAGQMVLINAGLIMASGLNSLVLDTGTHTITNSGVLESTGPGGMTVASTVENTGHLWANGGDLRLLADVTGDGSATIDGNATLTFSGAAHGSVAFHGEGAGTLVIAQAETAGSLSGILGLESDDMLTFGNLAFGANTQLSYNANASGAGGLLTVDDGVHRAEVNLLGHYSAEDFQVTDGGAAGTQVSYHGESSGTLVGTMLADTISGGDGNDIIVGREGADTLSGGAGADVFAYFNVNEGGDHILDYNYAEGDKIDLSALLKANFVSGTSQVSDFVQVVQTGSDITVKVDTDGASNGKNFVDVAVLDHTGTPGPDLVRTWFGDSEHTLTA